MPICQGCGGSFDSQFKFCPNCGRAAPADPNHVNIDVAVHEAQTDIACPVCKRTDRARKVTALHRSEVQKLRGMSEKISAAQPGLSEIGQRLQPPEEPHFSHAPNFVERFSSSLMAVGFVFALICIWVAARLFGDKAGLPVGLVFAGIVIGVIWYYWWKNNSAREREQREIEREQVAHWNHAMERWNRLYYCSRDDIVYIPGEGSRAPLDRMGDYLRSGLIE